MLNMKYCCISLLVDSLVTRVYWVLTVLITSGKFKKFEISSSKKNLVWKFLGLGKKTLVKNKKKEKRKKKLNSKGKKLIINTSTTKMLTLLLGSIIFLHQKCINHSLNFSKSLFVFQSLLVRISYLRGKYESIIKDIK